MSPGDQPLALLDASRRLSMYGYHAEAMSEATYFFGTGAGFKVIKFSLLQQPLHRLISNRALQVQNGLYVVTYRRSHRA